MMRASSFLFVLLCFTVGVSGVAGAQTQPLQAGAPAPVSPSNPMMGMMPNAMLGNGNNADEGAPQNPDAIMGEAGESSAAPLPVDTKVNPDSIPVELLILKKVEAELKEKFKSDAYSPANISSLFFTPAQQSLLNDARQGFNNALPEDLPADDVDETAPVTPTIPEISLGGILYDGSGNWTIWLNGVRTTSKNLPKQVLDIKVTGDYVELKWFDEATNQIFPVRLRPNQKFDITKKVFLPAG